MPNSIVLIVIFLIAVSSSIQSKASEQYGNDLGMKPLITNNDNKRSSKLAQSSDEVADKAFWDGIEGSDEIEDYESYLKWYPNGIYASQAKSEIKRLKGKEAAQLKVGKTFRDCDVCPEMVVVPAGSFTMGSKGITVLETPKRIVKIAKPFAIGKYEITFDEWDACLTDGGCKHKPGDEGWGRGKRPVINVSWENITKEYIPWLNRKTDKNYRLPTEAEWEYAARANSATPYWWGQTISTSQANFNVNLSNNKFYGGGKLFRNKTVPIDSFKPNAFGLYNVHGNVYEWVEDCFHTTHENAPPDGSAWLEANDGNCKRRMSRGGSWNSSSWEARSANRGPGPFAVSQHKNRGFRIARSLD